MKLDVFNINGEKTGKSVDLPKEIFGVDANEHTVYLAVKQYLANQRQGTHKSKERGEIQGSRKKIKRQKGTGTARAGDIKSPIFRGGGRIFGPRPRTYGIKLNRKVRVLARRSALSSKMSEGKIMIIEDFTFDAPKTSQFVNVVKNLKLEKSRTLFVTGDHDKNLYLSSRNCPKASVMNARDLNTYEILRSNSLVFAESSIQVMKEIFS